MRGEKRRCLFKDKDSTGSSPHARGKVSGFVDAVKAIRIIPACAGKSEALDHVHKVIQDHPRMRGEKAKEIS